MDWRRIRILGWGVVFVLFGTGVGSATDAEILVRGTVVAHDGGTIEDGRVRLFATRSEREGALDRLASREPEPVAETRPRADGRFEIAAPDVGMWRLVVEARDHLPMRVELLPLVEEKTLDKIELRRRETLDVRVVDPDGKPVAGAWVRAVSTHRDFWAGARSIFRRQQARPARRLATTDEEGKATLERAVDEEVTLRAGARGWVESPEVNTRSAAATLRLGTGRAFTVRAVGRGRQPLSGVVALVGEGHWPAAADAEGLLELRAPDEGELELHLSDPESRYYAGSVAPAPEPLEITLQELRRLAGQVIDKDSRRPVVDALVWPPSEPTTGTYSDRQGAFTIGVSREGEVHVMAARPGYARAWLQVPKDLSYQPTLALEPIAGVRGLVVDTHGNPVAEAEVGVRKNLGGGPMTMFFRPGGRGEPSTRTDEKGRFLLTGLDPGTAYLATARRQGFASGETELPELEPLATVSGVRIVLDVGARLVGQVIDDGGAPIPGARVALRTATGGAMRLMRAMRGDDGQDGPEAYSDNDGFFELRNVEPGSFDLEVSASGFTTATMAGVEVPEGHDLVDAGSVALDPGVELAGRVVDAQGRPIEGADVWAVAGNPMNRMRLRFGGASGEPAARSAADGYFALPDRRAGERVDLRVRRTGYSAEVLSGVEVPPVEPVEVVLGPASSLSGQVVDARGEPVPSARVFASVEGGGAATGGAVFMMGTAGHATSDQEGKFTMEDVEPGTVRLQVSARGFRQTELSNVEVPAGEDVEGLEIELLAGASLTGRVLAANGQPAIGAHVRVVEQQRRMGDSFSRVTTDGAGVYFLEGLEPGTRLIGANHEDEGEVTREMEIAEGENTLDLVFQGGVEVTGHVVDEAGAPVAGAVVFVNSLARFFRGGAQERTAVDGSFTFRGVRDGSYQVSASKEGFAQPAAGTPVEVAGAPVYGLEIRLAAGSVITGQIRGIDAARLATMTVGATSPPNRYVFGEVRHDGTYRIRDAGPGAWQVAARAGDTGATAEGRVTLSPGQPEAFLDLEFGLGLRVTGRVLMGTEPVSGVSVGLRGLDVQASASAVTARDGRFVIEGVEPGRHRLSVMDFATGLQHNEEHEIHGDVDLVVELRVSRVSGRVIDSTDSSPVAGAVVRLEPLIEQDDYARFFNRGSSTDSAGVFSIHNVSAGGYRLLAEKDGYSPGELSVQVTADRYLEDLELSLTPTEGLAMWVFLPSGGAASHVSAAVLDGAGRVVVSGTYRADQDGKVRLSKIPAGSWTVLVAAEATGVARFTAVAPGTAGEVRLPPEARLPVVIPELAEDRALVTVEALGTDGKPAPRFNWAGTVERHWRATFGRATLTGLTPGAWRVRATAPDGRVWEDTVSVTPGANPELVLR